MRFKTKKYLIIVRVPNDNPFSPGSVKRKMNSALNESKNDNNDDKKLKIESYGQTLHKKLKDVSKKNVEAQERLIWIELSHSYRIKSLLTPMCCEIFLDKLQKIYG
jgi:hypothetical protein